jgi:hypothetical protein
MAPSRLKQLVVCIDNNEYQASLERRKIYVSLADSSAEKHDLIRIIDESGEDYLYPQALFRAISVPESLKKVLLSAA